ncbi:MAG TPA: hypothetical protein VKT78_17545 [Fimbriimonadaceae bacterium]|nr:hypothetical protein [Fimbriimonadaceae bacterium]
MRFSKLFVAVGIATLSVFGAAVKDGALRVTGLVDDTRNYTLTASMGIEGLGDAKVSGKMTQKVIKVEDNGNLTIKETETVTVEINGMEMNQPEQVAVNVIRPDGTLVEIRGSNNDAGAYRIATVETLKLPDFALADGKTWTYDFPADPKTGVVKAKGEYKILGSETLHGIDSWKVQMKVTEVEGDAPAGTEGTAWISKKDASLVKMDGKAKNLPIAGAPGPVSGTETVELATTPDGGK